MAYETFSDIQEILAGWNIPSSSRGAVVVSACRQIYQDARFSFLLKTTSLSVSAGVADLPADYNHGLGILTAYSAVTGSGNDKIYIPIGLQDKDLYSTADYVYWLTWDSASSVFVFNTNQTTDTVTVYYFSQPTKLTSLTDVTPIPDVMAIAHLAASIYWAGKDDEVAERYNSLYRIRLAKMVSNDKINIPNRRLLKSSLDMDDAPSILATKR